MCDIIIQEDVPCVEIHHGFHDFLDEAKPVNIFDTSGGWRWEYEFNLTNVHSSKHHRRCEKRIHILWSPPR